MVTPRKALLVVVALFATIGLAWGGHEVPVYPSYYPHEIRVETMPPERAAGLLGEAKLHAYLGPEPRFAGATPQSVRAVESLGNFLIVRVNPGHATPDEQAACDIVEAVVRDMAGREGFVFHPYPVTRSTATTSTMSIKPRPRRRASWASPRHAASCGSRRRVG